MTVGWYFPPLCGGTEHGYSDQGIEAFKGIELIDNLAREICQNSLDAKLKDNKEPVRVAFRLCHIKQENYEMFTQFKKCIEGCYEYWGERKDEKLTNFLSGAKQMLSEERIPILIASDFNTTGLTGSKATSQQRSVWRALAHSDGTSVKGDGSIGSYGIGKNAPFACSDLSMVFYNTYAEDEQKAFKGVARIATLLQNGKETQSTGHYGKYDNDKISPIFDDELNKFRDLFDRYEYGTDIIIVGFNETENWMEQIEKAILKHFFIAIIENKLVVEIDGNTLDKDHLKNIFKNSYSDDKDVQIASQMYHAFTEPDNGEPYRTTILEENDIELYIKADKNYSRQTGYFRSTGMLVGNNRRNLLQRFAAVVMVRGEKLGELLRHTEPARHNKWDYTIIPKSQPELRQKAQKAIKQINEWVLSVLKSQFEAIKEDRIDSDMGDWLPDEVDDLPIEGNEIKGEDKLKVNQKIAGSAPVQPPIINREQAKKDIGDKTDTGDTHNKTDNPHPGPDNPPQPIDPNDDGETKGIGKGKGKKSIHYPNIKGQRIVPLDVKSGLYRVKLKTEKSYDNLYISFSSVGEDRKKEELTLNYYKVNNRKFACDTTAKIGPVKINADEFIEIIVAFEQKEKILIDMTVTEERSD